MIHKFNKNYYKIY